jgi:hypothetical protein
MKQALKTPYYTTCWEGFAAGAGLSLNLEDGLDPI